jgi:hypothetical protein
MDIAQLNSQIQSNTEMLHMVIKKLDGLNPEYMELEQVCDYTKLSKSTIKKYQFQIGCFKKDRKLLFKRTDVDAFIKLNTIKRV